MTSSTSSMSSTAVAADYRKKVDETSSASEGRSWKEIGKKVGKKLLIASIVILGIITVAALIVGIVALTAPGAFGILGTALTVALSWLLANAVYILIAGSLVAAAALVTTVAVLAKKRWGNKGSEDSAAAAA